MGKKLTPTAALPVGKLTKHTVTYRMATKTVPAAAIRTIFAWIDAARWNLRTPSKQARKNACVVTYNSCIGWLLSHCIPTRAAAWSIGRLYDITVLPTSAAT
jgi:hypothetical protein